MLNELRYAFRQLRNSPAFTATAVVTLALGIGANIAIFSLINSILLKPLPFSHQEQLVRIGYGQGQTETSFFPKGWIRALGEHASAFQSVSGFGPDAESNVQEGSGVARIFGAQVMANALDTLGVQPAAGRFFSSDDGLAGHASTAVLGYGYWRARYGANPAVVGQSIRIDGVSRQVIGVMPAGVSFPYSDTQFVTPVQFKAGDVNDPWLPFDLRAFGRLKPGVKPAQAQAEMRNLQRQLLPLFPWRMPDIWASEMTVVPLLEAKVGPMRPRLLLLLGAVGLILLIACANVANLMLARATGREREIAIRGALGASGSRIMRQLLTESLLLGLLAGIAGLAAAAGTLKVVVRMLPPDTPRLGDVSLAWPVFLFAAAMSLLAGLLFGLIPALRMASPNLSGALRSSSRGVAGKAGQFRLSMLLVAGQIALSAMVITAAGLMLHSLWTLSKVDPGFRAERVLTAEVALDSTACQAKGRCASFYSALLARLHGMPGVRDVALTDELPLTRRQGNYAYDAEGHPRDPRQGALLATARVVSPEYFSALGMTLQHGRLLENQDASGASRAVVINEQLAKRLWPGQDPVGRHILNVGDERTPSVWVPDKSLMVVGVVNNTREGNLAGGYDDEVYLPVTPQREQPVLYLVVRTTAGTREAAESLRRTVEEFDPSVPVSRLRALDEVVSASVAGSRSLAALLVAFGALALLIGGVGVYSLIAYIVSWRMREMGIRLALGAQRWQIVRLVLAQSMGLALAGSAAGLLGAASVAQFLRGFLYGVKDVDPVTYGAVPALMLVIAVLAAWAPARRAAAVDPMKTLRLE